MQSKLSAILKTLAKHGCAEMILALHERPRNYGELQKIVGNPATTQRTLKMMINQGLLRREVQQDERRTVRYYLTPFGEACAAFLEDLLQKENQ